MFSPLNLSPRARRHFYRRAALAPLCLCLVAGLHIVRVWTCRQTPWKGGGFGMFSTVDDESARFLRCYKITDQGDLPLAIPDAADKAVAEIRAAPTRARLEHLAQRLAKQRWRWRDVRQAREAAAIDSHQGVEISAATLRTARVAGVERSSTPVSGEMARIRTGFRRTIEPVPLDGQVAGAIAFQIIRLECWRYRYDDRGVLIAELLRAATAEAIP